MDKFETTRDVLSSLTPRETDALRRRIGIGDAEDEKSDDSVTPPPPESDGNGGSGGSTPATPLFE